MLAVAALSAAPLAADAPGFAARLEVLSVTVPVQVLGPEGRPVRDLGRHDLALFDRGERQALTGFERVDLDTLAAGASPPSAGRRRLVLLFDLDYSDPFAIAQARDAARAAVLENLHPSDLVAVAVYRRGRATLLMAFSPDRGQAARALDALADPSRLLEAVDPLRLVIDPAFGAADPGAAQSGAVPPAGGVGGAPAARGARGARARLWARSLAGLAVRMAAVEGRKQVLLFSPGFDGALLRGEGPRPAAAGPAAEGWRLDGESVYGDPAVRRDVGAMIEAFQAADCVLQAIDTAGLREVASDGRDVLHHVAIGTGGALLGNGNDLRAQLGRVLAATAMTYLLRFEPSGLDGDGGYHPLRVEGPRGAALGHRRGYLEPRPFAALDPVERALLAGDALLAAAPRDQLAFEAIAVPFRAAPGLAYVPIVVEVDGPRLLAEQPPGAEYLEVELYAYVTDQEQRIRGYFSEAMTISLAQGRDLMARGGLKYYGQLVLPAGRYQLRLLVRDASSGRVGLRRSALEVPAYDDLRPAVLPPLFFAANDGWVMARQPPEDGIHRQHVVYPFNVGGEVYVPAARPRLAVDETARLCLVAYNLGSEAPRLDATVRTADGRVVDGGHLRLESRPATGVEGLDKLLATFRPEGLPAGSYQLEIGIGSGSAVARSAIDFVVR